MKLIAYGAGRRYGNTEVLIKEALMAAEEMGGQLRSLVLSTGTGGQRIALPARFGKFEYEFVVVFHLQRALTISTILSRSFLSASSVTQKVT